MATEINRNASVTVGTDAVIISESVNFPYEERKVLTIINSSTGGQIITVSIGDMSTANSGIPLSPGGYYQESHDAGFTPTQAHISAISSAAGGTLSIQERKLVR
jgi:hypothetical protein